MRRLGTFVLMLLGLVALLVGCGGGEDDSENVVLAVAFHLDEGTPLMAAYIGDPAEDPFELPAGRYYIEALNEGEVGIWVGTVDLDDGDAVGFPESFASASGIADAAGAEPLLTVAGFLLDVELAEYAYLGIATGEFTLPPFDPAIELDAASVRQLFETHDRIAAQRDSLLHALSEIENRAEVSLGISYVQSEAASTAGEFDEMRDEARAFIDRLLGDRERERRNVISLIDSYFRQGEDPEYIYVPSAQQRAEFFDRLPGDLKLVGDDEVSGFDEWETALYRGRLDDKLADIYAYMDDFAAGTALLLLTRGWETGEAPPDPGTWEARIEENSRLLEQSAWLVKMDRTWQQYSRQLADDLGATDPAEVRRRLDERIRRNLAELLPNSPSIADRLAGNCLNRVVQAVPELAGLQPPDGAVAPPHTLTGAPPDSGPEPTATSEPDTSWIDGFVERVGERMIEEGYSEGLAAVVMVDLTDCLTAAVLGGQSMEDAVTACAATFAEPTPHATATAAPTATQPPQPDARGVTALGKFVLPLGDKCTVEENTMSLTFNTGGGPGSATGNGHWRDSCRDYQQCQPRAELVTWQLRGEYDPGSDGFTGTADMNTEGTQYQPHEGDPQAECDEITVSGGPTGIPWRATLQDGTLKGEILLSEATGDPNMVLEFELTVQE